MTTVLMGDLTKQTRASNQMLNFNRRHVSFNRARDIAPKYYCETCLFGDASIEPSLISDGDGAERARRGGEGGASIEPSLISDGDEGMGRRQDRRDQGFNRAVAD